MEIAGVIVSILECISPHVATRWKYHKNINKHLEELRVASESLISREMDIQRKLNEEEIPGVTEKVNELSLWLERFEKISNEIEEIKCQARAAKFFSRSRHARKVAEMVDKVDKLYQDGVFPNGELVRVIPQRGFVLPTTTMLEGETTSQKKENEIWACLLDENVSKIGIYGMGGIGKTTVIDHINNRLVEGNNTFDKVIYVTVSKASTLTMLQDNIARKLKLVVSLDDDEKTKASIIYKNLRERKRYVLILDDLWEAYALEKIGVPDPTSANGCKLLLTTRSRDVCSKMSCNKIIEMELLSEDEALKLFYKSIGDKVLSNPKLGNMVAQVAKECARLPLAIVTVAGSLRDKDDPNYWVTALSDLKDATSTESVEITTILRFSYDRLKEKKHQDCLLYCALYPEDYPIKKDLLIDQLIAEGIVKRLVQMQ